MRTIRTANTPNLELLEEYKGYSIERNGNGIIVVTRIEFVSFPFVAKSVEQAKRVIDVLSEEIA
jgi:hypothetical protein